jgi:hypothetical protein
MTRSGCRVRAFVGYFAIWRAGIQEDDSIHTFIEEHHGSITT